ncbi:MAG: hypothetical protein QM723_34235 [Myxococcaceae bacterium]
MTRLALFSLVVFAAGCKSCSSSSAPDAAVARNRDDVSPVYAQNAAPDPVAQKVCHALHAIHAERRAECCGGNAGPNIAEQQCVTMLSQSLQAQSVKVSPAKLKDCEGAQMNQYEGCAWPSLDDNLPAAACAELIEGLLPGGAVCRSSLECQPGLHCGGGGPTDLGHCSGPSKPPSACALAVDPLGTYTAQRLDDLHPECEGACERHRCTPALDAGIACVSSLECGPNRHCATDAGCVEGGLALKGEPCVAGGCANDLRCIDAKCAPAKKSGERCEHDSECIGACSKDGGVCGPRCH